MKPNEIHLIDRKALRQLREQHPELSQLQLANILIEQLEKALDGIEAERRELCLPPQQPSEPQSAQTLTHRAKGRRSISIFHDEKTAQQVKQTILYVVEHGRDKTGDAVRFGTETYSLTDFLVAIYFALVEQGQAVGVMQDVTKRYYEFLKESCRLDGLTSYRAFTNRFKLVRNLGKEFHQLTNEDFIHAKGIEGCMPAGKFPYWKAMVEAAEAVLDGQLLSK